VGWLRELMRLSSPPIDGYGELARRVLAHPEWPPDTQPQARSLAALFSKLDRGIEREWLADRDAAQRCLAWVLGCPIELVRSAVAPDPENHPRLRFDDLPYARPFDLRDEPLPPGVPARVLSPSTWGRLWWLAPSGSGRSLVGQWLAARGLARFVSGVSPAEVAGRLPGAGPLYLELERGNDFTGLAAALPEGPVCVAAPVPPTQLADAASWTVVESPPVDGVLSELLAWIEARVPQDGAFQTAAAEAWLRPPIAAGELPTLGAVLGAAGLLDARGVREARGKTLAELAEAFVNERLEQASTKGSAEAQWLKRHGFNALVSLAQSALISGDTAWAITRSQDEWIALVPAELEQNGDGGRGRASSVLRSAGQGPQRLMARPSHDAPPGAYRIVRALIDAGLLVERAPGRLGVSPEFLKHAVLGQAQLTLVHESSAFGWGEALLRPHAAPGVLHALYRRLAADDFGAVEELAELDAASSPALVVATEAALVCLGLRALSGAEVPSEYLEGVWNEQLGWLVELPGQLPQPRLLCFTAPNAGPLARHAVWMLALLAASELLGERQGRAHPLLRPWAAPIAEERLAPVLDAIYTALAQPDVADTEWAIEAFALGGRLLEGGPDDLLGESPGELSPSEASAAPPHPLARPARLARALLDGELDSAWLRDFGAHPLELRALQAACVLCGIAWSRMAHALWKNWQVRGCPAEGDRLFAPDSPDASHFWPHLPPEVMGTAWVRWTSAPHWPFACFGPQQWSAFVDYFAERWRRAASSGVWRTAFEHMDLASVQRAVERGRLLEAPPGELRPLLDCIWRRFPGWLSARLCESAASGDAGAVAQLLESAPHAIEDEIARRLGDELSRRSTRRPVIDAARAWLFVKISARRGDWRSAYAQLGELETRLARAERARGAPTPALDPGGER
jgi:hypothetical protein